MKEFLSLEYTLGVLDQQNRVKPLGRTLSSLADEWRKNPPAVISRSVALVIPDKGLSKKGRRGRLERREIILWTWSVAGCDRQSCWRAVPGTKLSQEQRDRRADRGRGATTRNQHSSPNSIERRALRHQD